MPTLSPSPTKTLRVLLVDDHPFVRQGIGATLNEMPDVEVLAEADSCGAALAIVAQEVPDIVITDLSLPDKSGIELLRTLTTEHPGLPVLILSIHEEDIYAERCLRAGARGYLMKSHGPESLIEAVRTVAKGRIYVSPELAQKLVSVLTNPGQAHPEREGGLKDLSDREFEVFDLVGRGRTAKEIASQLGLSSKTVDVHRARIRGKLNLNTTTDLTHYAVRWVQSKEGGTEI
jgi:DNA-binding NarL/FixJ family response regulator